MGNGDGTLQSAMSYLAGSRTTDLALGDLNGDGRFDLVMAHPDINSVAVAFGNGDGTFQTEISFAAGNFPTNVSIADFDADGRLDFVASNVEGTTVSVFLNSWFVV